MVSDQVLSYCFTRHGHQEYLAVPHGDSGLLETLNFLSLSLWYREPQLLLGTTCLRNGSTSRPCADFPVVASVSFLFYRLPACPPRHLPLCWGLCQGGLALVRPPRHQPANQAIPELLDTLLCEFRSSNDYWQS